MSTFSASFIPSGANSKLRHVDLAKHEIQAELYAVFPQMLRELLDKHPHLTQVPPKSTGTYTVLQACLLTAKHWKDREGDNFNLAAEVKTRRAHMQKRYRDKLQYSTWTRRGYKMNAPEVDFERKTEHLRQIASWDPEQFIKVKP